MSIKILRGDCREVLRALPDESVHCVVTSPPYWGLRDYGTATWEGGDAGCEHAGGERRCDKPGRNDKQGTHKGTASDRIAWDCIHCGARRIDSQLGLEPTYQEYVANMVEVFREVRRVLRKDGTLWLNLGDSYATSVNGRSAADTKATGNDDRTFRDKPCSTIQGDLKPKDICGIPWRVAFALQADGWYLRQDIIWSKPNPMPESVRDRCTKAHEYLFLLSKSERYYYDADAIREPHTGPPPEHYGVRSQPKIRTNDPLVRTDEVAVGALREYNPAGRNRRSVWEIATAPFSEAHFATFPPALIEPCIMAGTSEKGCCAKCGAPWVRQTARNDVDQATNEVIATDGVPGLRAGTSHDRVRKLSGATYQHVRGVTTGWSPSCACLNPPDIVSCRVLDPFGGAGTTGLVADRLGRNAILIELNSEYAEMAERRLKDDAGMFAEVL